MKDQEPHVQYTQLKGSEQHHELKNDPGKKGDPDHMKDDDKKDNDKTKD